MKDNCLFSAKIDFCVLQKRFLLLLLLLLLFFLLLTHEDDAHGKLKLSQNSVNQSPVLVSS